MSTDTFTFTPEELELSPFDPAHYLTDEDSRIEYLRLALNEGSASFLQAIGTVSRAQGMTQIARDGALGRESLYKAFRAGAKPRFETVCKVMQSLGLEFDIKTHNRA